MPRSVTRVPWRLALAALVLAAPAFASSHREAPGIATDPVADNTDVYFFRDPVSPSRLVMIANWIPRRSATSDAVGALRGASGFNFMSNNV